MAPAGQYPGPIIVACKWWTGLVLPPKDICREHVELFDASQLVGLSR